tara:strand:- start:550 stop:678 length:129 start_codon:yes stop_codon:yes gene_type:complete
MGLLGEGIALGNIQVDNIEAIERSHNSKVGKISDIRSTCALQ